MKSRQFCFVIKENCSSFMSIEVGTYTFINLYANHRNNLYSLIIRFYDFKRKNGTPV